MSYARLQQSIREEGVFKLFSAKSHVLNKSIIDDQGQARQNILCGSVARGPLHHRSILHSGACVNCMNPPAAAFVPCSVGAL